MTRDRPLLRTAAACVFAWLLGAGGGPVGADEERRARAPDPVPDALAVLDAAKSSPPAWPAVGADTWLVADELAARDALPVALRWVESQASRSSAALARYLRTVEATKPGPREALRQARRFLDAGQPESADLALRTATAPADTVCACELAWLRALASDELGRDESAAREAEAAADAARVLGWFQREDRALIVAADAASNAYRLEQARRLLARRVELLRPYGPTPTLATALSHRAAAEDRLGDLLAADESLTEAIAVHESVGPPADLAIALGTLGELRAARGRFLDALGLFTRGRRVLAALDGASRAPESSVERAAAEATVSRLEAAMLGDCGQVADAEREFRRAIDLATAAGDLETRALAEANLGVVLLRAGDLEEAEQVMEAAARFFESRRDSPLIAQSVSNWAEVLSLRGRHDLALALQEGALARSQETGDALAAARIRGSIGSIVRRAGRPAEALSHHRAAAEAAAQFGTDTDEAEQWTGLASAHLDLGDARSAAADAARAFDVYRRFAVDTSDAVGAPLRETVDELFEVGALAGARLDDPATTARFLEIGRATALITALGGRDRLAEIALPPALTQEEREAREEETAALTDVLLALRDGKTDPVARDRLRTARRRSADVIDRIQREQAAAAALTYPTPVTLETVRGALGAEDAFVWYGLFPRGVVAVVARPKGARVVRLATTEDAVTRAVETLVNGNGADATPEAIAALRALVVAPLALDGAVRRVVVCPAGALAYAPLGALFEGRTVAVAPSATALALLAREGTKRGQGILAVGDPAYGPMANGSAVQLMRGELRLTSLPATRDEALAVADGIPPLLGEQATEEGLRRALASNRSRLRALHLACHGLVDREQPLHSSLALTASGDDDGYLTGAELLRMRLDADLVVMSACLSGLGRVARGEGMLGLTRSIMFSGVPRIVASLWKVEDDATKALMLRFYAKWQPKDGTPPLSAAEALRDAQAFVRRQPRWDHPRYWAGWVLWGVLD